jgi:glycosyltransferase involved in cell wall biosynthesis
MAQNKILFIINGLGYGGAETHLLRLSNALLDKNWKVSLITMNNDLQLVNKLDKRIMHYKLKFSTSSTLLNLFKLFKIIRLEQPKLIHAHLFQANILSRFIKFFNSDIFTINTTHGSYLLNIRKYNPYFIYRITRKWVDYHTAVSNEVLELLICNKSIPSKKIQFLPNGINLSKLKPKISKTDKFLWLSAGRLLPVKDFSNLITACYIVREKTKNFELHIAGDGVDKNNLSKLIKRLKLQDNVKLIGLQPNMTELMPQYDSFVISSCSEGLPMVLLEAMSVGLPIVSTKVGQVPSILNHSNGGILVEPKDSERLADGMITMMSLDSKKIEKMQRANFEYIKTHFDINVLADSWIKIYLQRHVN